MGRSRAYAMGASGVAPKLKHSQCVLARWAGSTEIKFIDREEIYSVGADNGGLFLCVLIGGVWAWGRRRS